MGQFGRDGCHGIGTRRCRLREVIRCDIRRGPVVRWFGPEGRANSPYLSRPDVYNNGAGDCGASSNAISSSLAVIGRTWDRYGRAFVELYWIYRASSQWASVALALGASIGTGTASSPVASWLISNQWPFLNLKVWLRSSPLTPATACRSVKRGEFRDERAVGLGHDVGVEEPNALRGDADSHSGSAKQSSASVGFLPREGQEGSGAEYPEGSGHRSLVMFPGARSASS